MKFSPKICASISAKGLEELEGKIGAAFDEGSDYVEVRIDHLHEIDIEGLRRVLQRYAAKCIFTCRPIGEGGLFQGREEDRLKLLMKLSELRPAFLDVELNSVKDTPSYVKRSLSQSVPVIVSWHNFHDTPPLLKLLEVLSEARRISEYIKIVTTALTFDDNLRVLSLYREMERGKLIAFCMGEQGIISRILSPFYGSPFTYASLDNEATAPGQIPITQLRAIYDLLT